MLPTCPTHRILPLLVFFECQTLTFVAFLEDKANYLFLPFLLQLNHFPDLDNQDIA